jgi:HEAT repeat protein
VLWWTLQRLRSNNAAVRQRAVVKLYKLRDMRTVEPLVSALTDLSSDVRTIAARTLGEIGHPRGLGPLVAALRDWHSEVRWAAMEALVKIGSAAVEPLIVALTDADNVVRKSAAEVLGRLNDTRAIEPLLARFTDGNYEVRRQAARALEAQGWQPQDPVHRALVGITTDQFDQVAAEGAAAVEPLLGALTVDEPKVRTQAARALGSLGDTRAVDPLVVALRDADEDVRLAVAEALVCFRDMRASDPLVAVLTDVNADYQSRVRAIKALGTLKDTRTVEPLLAALNDVNPDVREAAAKVLGDIKDARSVTPLLTALKVQDAPVRSHATETLARMGDVAVTPLMDALKDKDYRVRARASEALAKMGQAGLKPLLTALEDQRSDVRQGAAATLAKTGDRRAMESLVAALWDDDSDVRKAAAEALEALGWQPRHAVEQALDAMARREWRQVANLGMVAVEPLLWALRDKRVDVRRGAAEVLAILGWQPTNVTHRVWFALALGKAKEAEAPGKGAVLPLLMALNSWDATGRMQAAEVLGQLGDVRAVEVLVTLAADVEVAAAAIHALERLLTTCVSEIATGELQAIVALDRVMQIRRQTRSYEDFIALADVPEPVECARVQQLARQELRRRGVES